MSDQRATAYFICRARYICYRPSVCPSV